MIHKGKGPRKALRSQECMGLMGGRVRR